MSAPACVGGGVDMTAIASRGNKNYHDAKALCDRCPMAETCLRDELHAMTAVGAMSFGMFAGTLPAERVKMIKDATAAAKAEAAKEAAKEAATAPVADTGTPDPAPVLVSAPTARKSSGVRMAGRKPIKHGTANGAQAHRRRKEKPCPECADAWRKKVADDQRERRARLRAGDGLAVAA